MRRERFVSSEQYNELSHKIFPILDAVKEFTGEELKYLETVSNIVYELGPVAFQEKYPREDAQGLRDSKMTDILYGIKTIKKAQNIEKQQQGDRNEQLKMDLKCLRDLF
jgi:hypothetical protein